jgi:hypothetical protein
MTHAPVDAARIKTVLEPFAAAEKLAREHFGDKSTTLAVLNCVAAYYINWTHLTAAATLLRDIDAQGAAPAGWPADWIDQAAMRAAVHLEVLACIGRVTTRAVGDSIAEEFKAYLSKFFSPALHAPTVEACAKIVDTRRERALREFRATNGGVFVRANFQAQAIALEDAAASIRTLTSGAEAGERTDGVHQVPWKNIVIESDRGASAEPPIRPNDDPPEQVRARAEAELRYPEPAADAGEVERPEAKPTDKLAWFREAGWSVAVHNDYRQNGEARTFWLFTHPSGVWAKGEGRCDEEAVNEAYAALRPAPTEEQVERAARIIDLGAFGPAAEWGPTQSAHRRSDARRKARAILAVGPAPQAGAGQ